MCVLSLSRVWLFVTPWPIACQTSLSMGFFRKEYWSGMPFPSPGDLSKPRDWTCVSCTASGCFTMEPPGKPLDFIILVYLISHYENTDFQSHQYNHSLAVPTMLVIINMLTEKFIWGSLQTVYLSCNVGQITVLYTHLKEFSSVKCLINSIFSVYFILLPFRDLKILHYLS